MDIYFTGIVCHLDLETLLNPPLTNPTHVSILLRLITIDRYSIDQLFVFHHLFDRWWILNDYHKPLIIYIGTSISLQVQSNQSSIANYLGLYMNYVSQVKLIK